MSEPSAEDAGTTSYWERRGWAGEVPVKITSRLDPRADLPAAEPAELTGMAFAGARGIQKVEVSLDAGGSWVPGEPFTAEQPHVWSLWRYVWPKPTPGRHTLMVRATDAAARSRPPSAPTPRPTAPAATTGSRSGWSRPNRHGHPLEGLAGPCARSPTCRARRPTRRDRKGRLKYPQPSTW